MMLKKKTSIPAIATIVLVALAIVGFSYAHWSECIRVRGEVETGELDAAIVTWYCNDEGKDPGYTKDVAQCFCSIDKEDPHYAYVTIRNAYPSYTVKFTCDIENTGTIPWFMQTPVVILANGTKIELVDSEWVDIDLDGDGKPDANFMYIDGENKQVHPGKYVEWSLRIHIKQSATPGTTYTFTISVDVVQWNMVE
ncbi:MAG: hypothetical protein QXG09_07050 [Candidatus Bathyarchaeia archaeon]